jgi:hypothetical protein
MGNFLGNRPTVQQPRTVSSGRWASTDFSQATTAEPNPTGWHHPGAVLEPVSTNGSQIPFGASRAKRLRDLEGGLKTSVAAITVSSTRILSSRFVKPRANLLPTTPASQHISENRHGYRVPAVSFAPEVFTGLSGSQILANSGLPSPPLCDGFQRHRVTNCQSPAWGCLPNTSSRRHNAPYPPVTVIGRPSCS